MTKSRRPGVQLRATAAWQVPGVGWPWFSGQSNPDKTADYSSTLGTPPAAATTNKIDLSVMDVLSIMTGTRLRWRRTAAVGTRRRRS